MPDPEPPNTNLFLFVMIPFFIGSSEMSRCRGLPLSLIHIFQLEVEIKQVVMHVDTFEEVLYPETLATDMLDLAAVRCV